jgi:hypothetical protein
VARETFLPEPSSIGGTPFTQEGVP